MTRALDDIAAERRRQIEVEGWTPEHDDGHSYGSLSRAAACYAAHASALQRVPVSEEVYRSADPARGDFGWPWAERWWKPTNPRRDLVKAGALIVAEIERLDRAEGDGGNEAVTHEAVCHHATTSDDPVVAMLRTASECLDRTPPDVTGTSCGLHAARLAVSHRLLSADPAAFQARVQPWMLACFGAEIAADRLERNDRFIEEALELAQALDYSADRAHALVDYVFGREIGEPHQEVGGVMVTLAALCLAAGLDMHSAGESELARINQPAVIEKIRAKQASKPTGSALPVPETGRAA